MYIYSKKIKFQIITTSGTFWLYSIFCAIGVVFVIIVVPETKGLDLETMHKLFEKKDKRKEDHERGHHTNSAFVSSQTNITTNNTRF